MKVLFIFLFGVISITSFSQKNSFNKNYIKFSAGRVLFGTGDVVGFSMNIEGSKNILHDSKNFLSKLLIGVEFSFENGTKNPLIENPTAVEFISKSFAHISNNSISGKLTYYPFRSLFNGFNISVGPSFGYSFHSFERRAERVTYSPTIIRRMSELEFDNRFILGYRVTTGYEFKISNRVAAGFRLDFASYTNGDVNTLVAGKVGYNF